MRYSLLARGKRLRPLLTIVAAELCGGKRDDALPAACAVEMIHAYSLIHDDLPAMDNDDLRRGQPTCHVKFGEANAILAGDALQALAFQTIAANSPSPTIAADCVRILADAAGCAGMVGGQADDMREELGFKPPNAEQWLLEIHRRKTGAIIRAALEMGASVAGANENQRESLKSYGEHFGLAFQITDDLLDCSGNEAEVGKRLRKDSEQNKLSWTVVHGIEKSKSDAAKAVEAAIKSIEQFGNPSDATKRITYEVLVSQAQGLLQRRK
jgi:geranylgeranyl diphosphate synthase type II